MIRDPKFGSLNHRRPAKLNASASVLAGEADINQQAKTRSKMALSGLQLLKTAL
jgi:hypothetical protein